MACLRALLRREAAGGDLCGCNTVELANGAWWGGLEFRNFRGGLIENSTFLATEPAENKTRQSFDIKLPYLNRKMSGHRIGVYGMAVMGQNLALNIAEKLKPHGQSVAVSNRSPGKVDDTVARAKAEGDLPLFGYKDVSLRAR